MQKRNLTLLIIVLVAILAVVFGYLYLTANKTSTSTTSTPSNNFFSDFLPFGKKNTQPSTTTSPANISGFVPTVTTEVVRAKLTKVSTMPVAGYGVFQKQRFTEVPVVVPPAPVEITTPITPTTTSTTKNTKTATVTKPVAPPTEFVPNLRYVERATGNIYETFADKIAEAKFSSFTIPRVYEAYFGNNGDSVVMQYLKDDDKTIETFVGTLPKEILGADMTGDNKVTGSFLPENVTDISIAPDSSKLFYLFNTNDMSAGVTSDFVTNAKSQIFQSPFTEWLTTWPNQRMVALTTKAAAGIPGFVYGVDPTTKVLSRVLGGFNGLTTLVSPSGKLILYGKDDMTLNIYNTATGNSTLLGVKTLPEKCAWGKNNDVVYCAVPKYIGSGYYPDSWYQGETSFTDNIWKIDAVSGNTILIADTSANNIEVIDGIKLSLDVSENYLFFINKRDNFLWELSLK